MKLQVAHQGYKYQDQLTAMRLVDVMLGTIKVMRVDKKLTPSDIFDDLSTEDNHGRREHVQIKYTARSSRVLTWSDVTVSNRIAPLVPMISSVIAERKRHPFHFDKLSFRIILCHLPPKDRRLTELLKPANPDPGSFIANMRSTRMQFCPRALQRLLEDRYFCPQENRVPFSLQDLKWVCKRLVVELDAPNASFDLTKPGATEKLLLKRVETELGGGIYPNIGRSSIDIANTLINCAHAARSGKLRINARELLRRTGIRNDFGGLIRRSYPVDRNIEVARTSVVDRLIDKIKIATNQQKHVLLVGEPGQGKSWTCRQLINELSSQQWLIAEHYCYIGDADKEKQPRLVAEVIFGSLMRRISEHDAELTRSLLPKFAASSRALEKLVSEAIKKQPKLRVAVVVDGIDHITRISHNTSNTSLSIAEELASLKLPQGSALIVLSQPGTHLAPLEQAGAIRENMPSLNKHELQQLADKHLGNNLASIDCRTRKKGFMLALENRSKGNALYATYLCKEVLKNPAALVNPAEIVGNLPEFDGSLENYYKHICNSLGDSVLVARAMALLDFAVSREELKNIYPEMAYCVDEALQTMKPVLKQLPHEISIYHESFARFLRQPLQKHSATKLALLDKITGWLQKKGLFRDQRAFHHLISMLAAADKNEEAIGLVNSDFVVTAMVHGFPASETVHNLAVAIDCAVSTRNWPAVVRYVEMSRSATAYGEEDRFESAIMPFISIIRKLLGTKKLYRMLLSEVFPIAPPWLSIQICAELDILGYRPPWRKYLSGFLNYNADISRTYDAATDAQIHLAFLRGRLRIASSEASTLPPDNKNDIHNLDAPIKWQKIAELLDDNRISAGGVIEAIFDTLGWDEIVKLASKLNKPGIFYLTLAEKIAEKRVSAKKGDSFFWTLRAIEKGVPAGNAARLFRIGMPVEKIDMQPPEQISKQLLELTRNVRGGNSPWENGHLYEWADKCAIAARKAPFALDAAAAMIETTSWYACWLRFMVALVAAEASPPDKKSQAGLNAFRILTEVKDLFLGKPRVNDLYLIQELISESIWRVFRLFDDQEWKEAVLILGSVKTVGGPIHRGDLLNLVVETVKTVKTPTLTRVDFAKRLIDNETKNYGDDVLYHDLAKYQLIAAKLALINDNEIEARKYWENACRLMAAYGSHKDDTIWGLVDSLKALIVINPRSARKSVSKLQPLCARIVNHTDGSETTQAYSEWWELLIRADPGCFLSFICPRLLKSCNYPDKQLYETITYLWRTWHRQTDPVIAGALRLSLESPVETDDAIILNSLTKKYQESPKKHLQQLLVNLFARIDEREIDCHDSRRLLSDQKRMESLNNIAQQAELPLINSLLKRPAKSTFASTTDNSYMKKLPLDDTSKLLFSDGMNGIAEAIKALQNNKFHDSHPDLAIDRFANMLGYRIIALVKGGKEEDADRALQLISEEVSFYDSHKLLKELAEGLKRFQQNKFAAKAYSLTWMCMCNMWLLKTLDSGDELDSLQCATQLDREVALETVFTQIRRFVGRGYRTMGTTQFLIHGFAKGGLDDKTSVAFDVWDAAFEIIAKRAPHISDSDHPENHYNAPDKDCGKAVLGNLDTIFASAVLASLAHPGREQKRRSFLAIQLLIDQRASIVADAFDIALESLSDTATLTWLLRVIEIAGNKAKPIISKCHNTLAQLASDQRLTIRAISRRLLDDCNIILPSPENPDAELLNSDFDNIITPANATTSNQSDHAKETIYRLAGNRISQAEKTIFGLSEAVCRRVNSDIESTEFRQRMRAQIAWATEKKCFDAFLATNEVVENALQLSAAGARAARLRNEGPVNNPVEFEEEIAQALLDNPQIPLALEVTRQPRPDIHPPPIQGDPLWNSLHSLATVMSTAKTGFQAARLDNDLLCGVDVAGARKVPKLIGRPFNGWRLMASIERRKIPLARSDEEAIAVFYRSIELGCPSNHEILFTEPFAKGDWRRWKPIFPVKVADEIAKNKPIVGHDFSLHEIGDGKEGLGGLQLGILTPSAWLINFLGIQQSTFFVADNLNGPVLALISWRTEYTGAGQYGIERPRLQGLGLAVRNDAFEKLIFAHDNLKYRSVLKGPSNLCDKQQ